jgi:hypothetical protein
VPRRPQAPSPIWGTFLGTARQSLRSTCSWFRPWEPKRIGGNKRSESASLNPISLHRRAGPSRSQIIVCWAVGPLSDERDSELQSLHSYPSSISNADLSMTQAAQHCQAERRPATWEDDASPGSPGTGRHSTMCLSFNFQTFSRVPFPRCASTRPLASISPPRPHRTWHIVRAERYKACGFAMGTVNSGPALCLRARARHENHGLGSVRLHRSDRDSLAARNSHHSSRTRTG